MDTNQPTQEISVPPSPSPIPPQSPKFTPTLILGGLVLLIIGVGGVFLARNLSTPRTIFPSATPSLIPSSTPTQDPTANWKTYTYSNFLINVPPGWRAGSANTKDFAQLANYDPDKAPRRDFDPSKDLGVLKVEIYSESSEEDLNNFVKRNHLEEESIGETTTFSDEQIFLNNSPAIKSRSNFGGAIVYVKHPAKPLFISIAFLLDFGNYQELADQILSTFKFL